MVSTRSGKVTDVTVDSTAREEPAPRRTSVKATRSKAAESTPAKAPPRTPVKTPARTSAKSRLASEENVSEDEQAFKLVSPVKMTPRHNAQPDLSPPQSASKPNDISPPSTKQKVNTISQMPLPDEPSMSQLPYMSSDDEQHKPASSPLGKAERVKCQGCSLGCLSSFFTCAFAGIFLAVVLTSAFLGMCIGTRPLPPAFAPFCQNAQPAIEHLHRYHADLNMRVQQLAGPYASQLSAAYAAAMDAMNAALNKGGAPLNKDPASAPGPPTFASTLPRSAFRKLVAEGEQWSEEVADMYTPVAADAAGKAHAVVLTCTTASGCAAVAQNVAGSVKEETQVELISGLALAEHKDSAGQLQTMVANFAARAPNGVVVVSGFEHLGVGPVAVMNNVLSEAGSLQRNGRSVPTSGLLVVVVMQSEVDPADEGYASAVKEQVRLLVESQAEDEMDTTTRALASALRRRINHVLPAAVLNV